MLMIPTAFHSCPGCAPSVRRLIVALGILLASGCTNSKLIIGPLYNRLDDQMREGFHKLGDFNSSQEAAFEAMVGTFHVWHRQSELPRYAALLDDIQASIASPDTTQPDEIRNWIETAEGFTQAVRHCHPANYSFDLTKTLTDDQVNSIEQRFNRQRQKHREKRAKRTREERIDDRVGNITKWSSRAGLKFNDEQRKMLHETMEKQISLRQQYYRLSNAWKKRLFTLARDQQASNYDELMAAHLGELWTLLEKGHPNEWRQNRQLWQDFAVRFVDSLTPDQRRTSSRWIRKMSTTLKAISRDTPSFKVGQDPSVGCLVDKTAIGSTARQPTQG